MVLFQRYYSTLFSHTVMSFVFMLFSCTSLFAQPGIEWSKGLGGSLNDIPEMIIESTDGNFVIAGNSASFDGDVGGNNGGVDLWVTKLSSSGVLIWEKNYGGSQDDYAMDLQSTADGGYIMIGGSESDDGDLSGNNGRTDVWVVKISSSGDLQWSKNFGGSGVDIGTSLGVVSDGYILAGCTSSAGQMGISSGFGGNEFWVLKIDLDGNLDWEKTYGGKRHDVAKEIIVNDNNEYIVAGNTWSNGGDISSNHGHGDVWVIKLNNVGELLWESTFGGESPDRVNDLSKTADGNYILAGLKSELDLISNGFYGRYDEQGWILKFSESGQMIWEKTLGGNKYDEAFSVQTTSDGGFIIGNSVQSDEGVFSNHAGGTDIWMVKTDELGNEEWSQLYGGEENDDLKLIQETTDGGLIMLASTDSYFIDSTFVSQGAYDWWVVKFLGNTIDVNLGNDLVVCPNEIFTLDANIEGCNCTYLWSDGNTDSIRNLSINSSTTYSVTVTNAGGIEGTDQISILVSEPMVSIAADTLLCHGTQEGTINLIPDEQNYAYHWSTGATTQNLDNLIAGTYTVTITDQNGCTIIEPVMIVESTPIVITEDVVEVDCNGGNTGSIDLSISGGVGDYDFNWSNGATSQNISQLNSGTYTVTVTDVNACQEVKEIIVSQNTNIQVFSQLQMPSCYAATDGAINIFSSGGTGSFSFLWNTGQETEDIDELIAGDYILTITDGNGCEEIQLFTLEEPDSLAITSDILDVTCYGENTGMIQLDAMGGNGGYQYQWNNNANTSNVDSLFAGSYSVTVLDINGCEKIEIFEVSQPDSIIITTTISEISCYNGMDGAIELEVEGGTGGYIFEWNVGTNLGLSSGEYTVTISDMNNCEVIQNFVLTEPDSLIIDVETIHPINGDDGNIIATPSGGTPPYEFIWNGGVWNTAEISNLPAGVYDLIVEDNNGCEVAVSILLESTAITEISNLETFEIFPNPNTGEFYVKLAFKQKEAAEIAILNDLGQLIQKYNWSGDFILEKIKLAQLTAGIFFIKIKTDEGIKVKRVVIQ